METKDFRSAQSCYKATVLGTVTVFFGEDLSFIFTVFVASPRCIYYYCYTFPPKFLFHYFIFLLLLLFPLPLPFPLRVLSELGVRCVLLVAAAAAGLRRVTYVRSTPCKTEAKLEKNLKFPTFFIPHFEMESPGSLAVAVEGRQG